MFEDSCSSSSAAVGEPTLGSAPVASGWVCLEQTGPWGRTAWTSSHLDPVLGAAIEAAAAAHGLRPALIRRPGRHADPHASAPRRVLVAHSRPGRSWLLAGLVEAPDQLLALDWAAVAAGASEAVVASLPTLAPAPPQLLVCTNGTRDTCCARLGRPVAAAAGQRFPDRVWEVTHTSGHRFAPTTVLLPSGVLHGRVLDAAALLTAETTGEIVLEGYRGRSVWPAPGQVAEGHIRQLHDVTGLDDLTVDLADPAWTVIHRDGRSWTVDVTTHVADERPESCGKADKPVTRYAATVTALGAER